MIKILEIIHKHLPFYCKLDKDTYPDANFMLEDVSIESNSFYSLSWGIC